MKLEAAQFTTLSNQDMQILDGGGTLSSLVSTVEGVVNPLVSTLDSLISSLPLSSIPGLSDLSGLLGL